MENLYAQIVKNREKRTGNRCWWHHFV